MFENLKSVMTFIFGSNQKDRFHRITIFILLIVVAINLILNISCGVNSDGKFYFQWKPAADINIEVKK